MIPETAQMTVREIEEYLNSLNDEELIKYIKLLKFDKRKTIQKLVKKYMNFIEKKSAEEKRLKKLWEIENKLNRNYKYIVGIDEAGRGPLAGPVVAAAVILPPNCFIEGLNDSKKLTEKDRIKISREIKKRAIAWAVGVVDSFTIDKINIYEATKYAMKLAIDSLGSLPQYALIDGMTNPLITIPQLKVTKGDSKSASIAAASVIAKVYRDNLMNIYDELYPQYNFKDHKGYGTEKHLNILRKLGPSPIHRRTFKPINLLK